MAAIITYTASVQQNRETGKIECIVIESYQAGASSPALSFEVETTDVNLVDIELAQRGFTRTAGWTLGTTCQGMELNTIVKPAQGKKWGDL